MSNLLAKTSPLTTGNPGAESLIEEQCDRLTVARSHPQRDCIDDRRYITLLITQRVYIILKIAPATAKTVWPLRPKGRSFRSPSLQTYSIFLDVDEINPSSH